jgi:urea carboxylase-associated protein 2
VTEPLVRHEIPGDAAWSVRIAAGRALRLTALGDGANCSTLIFAARHRVDRLNVPDTLKAQMSARVHAPMVLMSDLGTALCSVTGSSVDWHDCVCGHSLDVHVAAFGPSSYHSDRNERRISARAALLSELRKQGMGPADLHGCVNFFSKVVVTDAGALAFVSGHACDGDWVELRAEQDLLVVLSTAPHPLDLRWAPQGVLAQVWPAQTYGPDDPSVTWRAESARALRAAREVFV